MLTEPIAIVSDYLDEADRRDYVRKVSHGLITRLEGLGLSGFDHGYCHGDLQGGNCHWIGDSATHFDFDFSGFGWRAYDIAVFKWNAAFVGTDWWPAFERGYRSERDLGEADWTAIPLFVILLLAEGKGLSISADRLGKFYLTLDEAPDDGTQNPGIVLIASSLKQIEDFLYVHTGPHRVLSPAEVSPEIMPLPPDAENEDRWTRDATHTDLGGAFNNPRISPESIFDLAHARPASSAFAALSNGSSALQ